MQSLSRSRDENLVVDIESAIRLAQQQAQLTGSVQPLLAALNSAEQRLTKVAQPRLAPVLRAVTRYIERIKALTLRMWLRSYFVSVTLREDERIEAGEFRCYTGSSTKDITRQYQ
jgi:hypothetical protein